MTIESLSTIGGAVLLGAFVWLIAAIGACAVCDREFMGWDE